MGAAQIDAADQLLMTLLYWREDRTEFYIGLTYGVGESTVCRTIRKIDDVIAQKAMNRALSRRRILIENVLIV